MPEWRELLAVGLLAIRLLAVRRLAVRRLRVARLAERLLPVGWGRPLGWGRWWRPGCVAPGTRLGAPLLFTRGGGRRIAHT